MAAMKPLLSLAVGLTAVVALSRKLHALLAHRRRAHLQTRPTNAAAEQVPVPPEGGQRPMMAVVAVGSKNKCKVQAVSAVLRAFPELASLRAVGFAAPTGVSDQPMSLQEVIQGAKHRAEAAAELCKEGSGEALRVDAVAFSVGLESGLMRVGDDFFDVCACAIWDGTEHHLGFSCCFKIPAKV